MCQSSVGQGIAVSQILAVGCWLIHLKQLQKWHVTCWLSYGVSTSAVTNFSQEDQEINSWVTSEPYSAHCLFRGEGKKKVIKVAPPPTFIYLTVCLYLLDLYMGSFPLFLGSAERLRYWSQFLCDAFFSSLLIFGAFQCLSTSLIMILSTTHCVSLWQGLREVDEPTSSTLSCVCQEMLGPFQQTLLLKGLLSIRRLLWM